MPPVSQFPPARVFLKATTSSTPSPISTTTARKASVASLLSPRFTTMSMTGSQTRAQGTVQQSSASSFTRRSEVTH
ncbi:hypothetical protein J1614_003049 [Plenodomus biglobosus]|nr:hypothetical protein J1614_003049 [Plenodomus biglobosus]